MTTELNTKEILPILAKLSGFGDHQGRFIWTESEYPKGSGSNGALWNFEGYMDTAVLWNPLTDDGDAFRLAAKLRICIEYSHDDMEYLCYSTAYPNDFFGGNCGADINVALRQAIVKAALFMADSNKGA